ncbi:MAG: GIY-YIG nuclease family protein [Candidatus Methanomethylophilus sp.]|nr:GIY-YIG nuclease family protein [Methanomethylophilus sp.]MBO5600731.1 GIY-YIG nuclease family protein [Methanomethylophilus sp.]
MSVRKGTYVLFVTLGSDRNITVGARGPHLFKAGTYCYVGSAMAGLDQRLTRHLAHEKTLKWHIDYLTTVCDSSEAWISYPDPIPECELADRVGALGGIPEMEHFGCSDCRCLTHLFRVDAGTKAELVSELHLARYRSP